MIALLQAASGVQPFAAWARVSESLGRTDKLENHLNVLYTLLEDVSTSERPSGEIRNTDVRKDLEPLPARRFEWLRSPSEK